jgi:hypothetical protein
MYFLDPRLYVQFNFFEIIDHNINLKHTASSKKHLFVMWQMLFFLKHAMVMAKFVQCILHHLFSSGIIHCVAVDWKTHILFMKMFFYDLELNS